MRRRRRRPSNPFVIFLLIGLIGAACYFNQFVVPTMPPLFEPSPTPTRSPESFTNEAKEAFDAGKLPQAVSAYKQAILSDPGNAALYVELARVQVFSGLYKDALDSAEKALIRNPDYSMAHAVRAWALDFLDEMLEAEGAVRKAIELDPANGVAYAYYAEILIDTDDYGNIEKAIEMSRKAQEIAPNTLETHRARGYVLLNTQNVTDAIEEFKAALSFNDKLWELHYQLGLAYRANQEYDLAVQELNQAFALNATNANIPTVLARTQLAAGQYGKAVQYAEQAIKLDPSNPGLHGTLGFMLYKEKRDFKRAADELQLAVRGGTTDEGVVVQGLPLAPGRVADEYYSVYGLALTQLDRCAEAVPVFQLILGNIGEDQVAYYNAVEGIGYCQDSGTAESTPVP